MITFSSSALLIARILYPSFYFDKYDDIVNNKENESSILKITSRINEYEKYLNDIFRKNVGLTPRQYREEFAKKYSM